MIETCAKCFRWVPPCGIGRVNLNNHKILCLSCHNDELKLKDNNICEKCGRQRANNLEEWDDALELLCFGKTDPLCASMKKDQK